MCCKLWYLFNLFLYLRIFFRFVYLLRTCTSVNGKDEKMPPVQVPDLRQVTVVPKAEWLRIQDGLNHVNKQNESLKEASNQREILHLRSQEVVKFWPNTIAVRMLQMQTIISIINQLINQWISSFCGKSIHFD